MKIHGSKWRQEPIATSGPEEVAFEESQALHRANIERLKAKKAELERKIFALKCRLERSQRDWLCYLPSAAGSPEVIARACTYLEAMRTRIEAEGGRMWLCADHDCATHVFEITEFGIFAGAVFCAVEWTNEGRRRRHSYKGVSPDTITFAGDFDLMADIHRSGPADCLSMDDMPAEVRAAAQSDQVRGLAGAAMFSLEPAYGITPIYRLSSDKKRLIEATPLSQQSTTN